MKSDAAQDQVGPDPFRFDFRDVQPSCNLGQLFFGQDRDLAGIGDLQVAFVLVFDPHAGRACQAGVHFAFETLPTHIDLVHGIGLNVGPAHGDNAQPGDFAGDAGWRENGHGLSFDRMGVADLRHILDPVV